MSVFAWTEDERAKARYVARRAIRLGRDPVADIMLYMGMPRAEAEVCARQGGAQIRAEGRRRPVTIINRRFVRA